MSAKKFRKRKVSNRSHPRRRTHHVIVKEVGDFLDVVVSQNRGGGPCDAVRAGGPNENHGLGHPSSPKLRNYIGFRAAKGMNNQRPEGVCRDLICTPLGMVEHPWPSRRWW